MVFGFFIKIFGSGIKGEENVHLLRCFSALALLLELRIDGLLLLLHKLCLPE